MADKRDFAPQHPGTYLRERVLRAPGSRITQEALAEALDVSRFTVSQIINGHRTVTADMAVRLAHVLGTSADLWLDMQKRVDLFEARRKLAEERPDLVQLREVVAEPPTAVG